MGTKWDRSGKVELDNSGQVAAGALAYFYAGNTTTPITVYQDADESAARAQPVTADGNGRWPLVFIPYRDGGYDEKVTTAGGTQLSYFQEIPNENPVEAASASVSASELISTGHVIWRPVGGTLSGYVRCNGRTLGNAASGATERANADTEDLFVHLWDGLANGQAAVSTGRGASAAADYAANKTITLPDLRGAGLVGIDDMGNSALGAFASVSFSSGSATIAGGVAGSNTIALSEAQMYPHRHTFAEDTSTDGGHTPSINITDPGHTHTGIAPDVNSISTVASGANFFGTNLAKDDTTLTINSATTSITATADAVAAHDHSVTGSTSIVGSGSATPIMSKMMLGTFYMKL